VQHLIDMIENVAVTHFDMQTKRRQLSVHTKQADAIALITIAIQKTLNAYLKYVFN
jgi:hypothetical protein